jgi:D-glucosaminate-6-phosphate ammonia-lyase
VIVDAAAQLPPRENLTRLLEQGADLVCFSGGKAIGGPQATGILAGRADLVASALAQQLDMDFSEGSWNPPPLLARFAGQGTPQHGLGRGFKAGKEEILGLLVALERFAAADEGAELAARRARLAAIASRLSGLNSARPQVVDGARGPLLEIALEPAARAAAAAAALKAQQPAVHLAEARLAEGVLLVDPTSVAPADDAVLAEALLRVLQVG